MTKKNQKRIRLSPGELEIMEMLWSEKRVNLAGTLQWFHARERILAPTTLHTRLNRLVDKGLIKRVAENPAVYEAAIDREQVSGRYFDLFEELCGQNLVPLMSHLAEKREFTQEEIDYLEQLVSQKRNNKKT